MKVGVIGIDGLDFDVTTEMMANGELPNLKKLSFDGEPHLIETYLPAMSASVWTTLTTGVNPGVHGIFDFFKTGSLLKLKSSKDILAPTIWETLSKKGKKCLVMNVPLTYPPARINGAMIAGIMSPDNKGNTNPSNYKNYIQPYEVEPSFDFENETRGEIIEKIYQNFSMRFNAFSKLLDYADWDFFFIVFNILDRGSHYYFGKKELKSLYLAVDHSVGVLMDRLPDWGLIAVSDHGFRKIDNYFFIEEWLKQKNISKVSVSKPIMPDFVIGVIRKIAWIIPKNRRLQRYVYQTFFQSRAKYHASSPVTFYSNASRYLLCDPEKKEDLITSLKSCEYIEHVIDAEHHLSGDNIDERMIFLVGKEGIEIIRGFGQILSPGDGVNFFPTQGTHRWHGTVLSNTEEVPKKDTDLFNIVLSLLGVS